jgi:ABC-type Zn uptake system ZnuABC Zn-binding protein ZnuA
MPRTRIEVTPMRRIPLLVALLMPMSLPVSLHAAAGPIQVAATIPNLGSIAREVGGDQVQVTTIATGQQDPHFVDPKPSFIVLLRRADLLVVNGLDLEVGWVPPLTQGARNRRIQPGEDGYIDASRRIAVLEVPAGPLSRSQGDVHPYGNPHYLGDPLNAEIVAGQLAEAFTSLRPEAAAHFEARRADFVKRLHIAMFGAPLVEEVGGARRLARSGELESFLATTGPDGRPLSGMVGGWMGRLRQARGARVVTYHRDATYFAQRFGLDVVDFVEPKPGIPPSARHLAELTERLKHGDVRMIITRPYVEGRSTDALAERTGVPVLVLPMEVDGAPEATDYLKLYDFIASRIAASLERKGAP